jgi:pimeloyl-ACP methyl ester carboxylesterase
MARHLEDISGLQTIGVPLMPWHWWTATRAEDATNVLAKVQETVAWARRRFQARRFVLVGHSAGGLIGRLYLHEGPVWGQVYAGAEDIEALISLGSPHCSGRETELGWFLADTANRLAPGTPYADRVRYLTVAGRYIQGQEHGTFRERQAFVRYRFFAGQGQAWGDGVVPLEAARLDDAPSLILEGIAHSRRNGLHWFGGSPEIIRRWWPEGWEDGH